VCRMTNRHHAWLVMIPSDEKGVPCWNGRVEWAFVRIACGRCVAERSRELVVHLRDDITIMEERRLVAARSVLANSTSEVGLGSQRRPSACNHVI
jgi:hypothetical protein